MYFSGCFVFSDFLEMFSCAFSEIYRRELAPLVISRIFQIGLFPATSVVVFGCCSVFSFDLDSGDYCIMLTGVV